MNESHTEKDTAAISPLGDTWKEVADVLAANHFIEIAPFSKFAHTLPPRELQWANSDDAPPEIKGVTSNGYKYHFETFDEGEGERRFLFLNIAQLSFYKEGWMFSRSLMVEVTPISTDLIYHKTENKGSEE
mgnify:CR=1 FL=1|tara:strand:+ start:105 stop:497 length:393 start_codon:yes stop_codon:yes gene_type:complete